MKKILTLLVLAIIGITTAFAQDADGDGVPAGSDTDDSDQYICSDLDADGCDDCSVAGLQDVNNDGPDNDADGICDSGDPDDDNDGIPDVDDDCPFVAYSISITAVTNLSCNGAGDGSIDLSISGGSSPFTYNWSGGAGSSQDPSSLAAGAYSVTATDNTGCTDTITATVTEPTALGLTAVIIDVSCGGEALSDGSIDLSVSGGISPYSYNWSNSTTVQDAANLLSGSYAVTVTDNNGCITNGSYSVNEPAALTTTITTTDASCSGSCDGSATAAASGGTTPYAYLWNDPDTQTVATSTGLCSGTYTVAAADANACISSANAAISEPAAIASNTGPDQAICEGANANLSGSVNVATGGTWTTSGNGIFADDTLLTTTYTPGGLDVTSGTATLTLTTTGNGSCAATSDNMVLTINSAPTLTIITVDPSCSGGTDGSATVSASDGITPYTYTWPNGATNAINTGLSAGSYTVTVTDNNSCKATVTGTITEPAAISVNITTTDVNCNGGTDGSATATVSGGVTPYVYNWSTTATTSSITSQPAGTHSLTVTDANGCGATNSVTITEPAPIALDPSVSIVNATCFGYLDGSIDITVTGGSSPYSYLWNDPNSSITQDVASIGSGTYTVAVTDTAVGSVTVAVAIAIQPFASVAVTE